MADRWKTEKALLLFLSQCPSGLTLTDIQALVKETPDDFGNWQGYLNDMIPEQHSCSLRDIDLDFLAGGDGSDGLGHSCDHAKKESSHGFQVIKVKNNEPTDENVYCLDPEVRQFITQHVLETERCEKLFKFLKYFGKLGRQYLRCRKV